MQMLEHGISTGALFILAGQLHERIHTRDLNQMGRLWEKVPVMGAIGLIFSMASLGLPGLGNFIAELLVLIGAFKANVLLTSLACLGLIAATIYSLRIVQKVFFGNKNKDWKLNDLTVREKIVSASLVVVIVWLGLFPNSVFNIAKPALQKTLNTQEGNINRVPERNTFLFREWSPSQKLKSERVSAIPKVIGIPNFNCAQFGEERTCAVKLSPQLHRQVKCGVGLKIFRADAGGNGFWRVFRAVARKEKTAMRAEG
jgi:hypothetical protein